MRERGLPVLPHQDVALQRSADTLTRASREAARDLRAALARRPSLARDVDGPGGLQNVLQAMATEARVRSDPELRADGFVRGWSAILDRVEAEPGLSSEDAMRRIAGRLQRDPDLVTALERRRAQLGLGQESQGFDLSRALGRVISLGRSIER
jgi:hypothetical protein